MHSWIDLKVICSVFLPFLLQSMLFLWESNVGKTLGLSVMKSSLKITDELSENRKLKGKFPYVGNLEFIKDTFPRRDFK